MVFVLLAVLIVAGVGYIAGATLFGIKPLSASVSGSTLTVTDTVLRTVLTIVFVVVSMLGLAAIAIFASTRTDSSLSAALAALATFVTSQVLDLLDASRLIRPYLPTHYWLSFVDLYRDPLYWDDIIRGFALQGVYIVVFLGLAWASFATKDITS